MAVEATFTKRVGTSRKNFVIWIPKDVAGLLRIKPGEIFQIKINKLRGEQE